MPDSKIIELPGTKKDKAKDAAFSGRNHGGLNNRNGRGSETSVKGK